MLLGVCPAKDRLLIGYESVRSLFNLEPGVMVMWWECPCGEDHFTACGRVAEADPKRAAAAIRAVRSQIEVA
jgi:hypothetical protein